MQQLYVIPGLLITFASTVTAVVTIIVEVSTKLQLKTVVLLTRSSVVNNFMYSHERRSVTM